MSYVRQRERRRDRKSGGGRSGRQEIERGEGREDEREKEEKEEERGVERREEIGERMYVRIPCAANGRRGVKLKASKGAELHHRAITITTPHHTTLEALTSVPVQNVCQPTQKSEMTSSIERLKSRSRRQHEGEKVISRKQDEEEGEGRVECIPHVESDVVSRTSSRSSVSCISTDLTCGELGGTKGDGHGGLDDIHHDATHRDCSINPNLVHILHLCIY